MKPARRLGGVYDFGESPIGAGLAPKGANGGVTTGFMTLLNTKLEDEVSIMKKKRSFNRRQSYA